MSTDFDSVDYFTDPSLIPDPHPYYDHIRAKDPVCCPINNGVLAVTGWQAANAVYKDSENYSSCVAVMGPFTPMPFVPEGDDICEQLEQHRTEIPMFEHMVTMDPPHHTDARSVLSRLLTPKRLKENEDFMWRLADRHIDEFIADGSCEFLAAYAKPFSLLAVADLLGVPEDDHEEFREAFGAERPGSNIGGLDHEVVATNPLAWADEKFEATVETVSLSPTKVGEVVTYMTTLVVNNEKGLLRPGMTASVTIETGKREGVLRVPAKALWFKPPEEKSGFQFGRRRREDVRERGSAVHILAGEKPERVVLQLGRSDGDFVEVRDGSLKEGDVVITGQKEDEKKDASSSDKGKEEDA